MNEGSKGRRLKRNFVARVNYHENNHCALYPEGKSGKNCQFHKKDDEETEEKKEVHRNLTYSCIQLRRRDKAWKAFEFLWMFCFDEIAFDSCHAIVKEDMETFESNKFEYFLVFVVVIHLLLWRQAWTHWNYRWRKLQRQGNIFDGQLEIRFSVLHYFLVWRKILRQKNNLTQGEIFNQRKKGSYSDVGSRRYDSFVCANSISVRYDEI
mgnify:FL=1